MMQSLTFVRSGKCKLFWDMRSKVIASKRASHDKLKGLFYASWIERGEYLAICGFPIRLERIERPDGFGKINVSWDDLAINRKTGRKDIGSESFRRENSRMQNWEIDGWRELGVFLPRGGLTPSRSDSTSINKVLSEIKVGPG